MRKSTLLPALSTTNFLESMLGALAGAGAAVAPAVAAAGLSVLGAVSVQAAARSSAATGSHFVGVDMGAISLGSVGWVGCSNDVTIRRGELADPLLPRCPLVSREAILAAMTRPTLLACLIAAAVACARPPAVVSPTGDRAAAEREIARALDDLNDAAARSDLARYFGHYAPGAVFLGTDAGERWDLAAFHVYADPRFAKGKGWVFHVVRRAVDMSPDGAIAWFDEDLRGDKLGAARGSGVLVRDEGRWRVSQYNLALTVPNERFPAVRAADRRKATAEVTSPGFGAEPGQPGGAPSSTRLAPGSRSPFR